MSSTQNNINISSGIIHTSIKILTYFKKEINVNEINEVSNIFNSNIKYSFLFLEKCQYIKKINSSKYYILKGINSNDYNDKVIKHYLYSHAQVDFFDGFKNIDFDLIDNMVKWTDKENCFDKVKANYETISKKVERKEYDYFSNNYSYEYKDEIREEFQSLYRHIQISKII
jgi:hypothetical protein